MCNNNIFGENITSNLCFDVRCRLWNLWRSYILFHIIPYCDGHLRASG